VVPLADAGALARTYTKSMSLGELLASGPVMLLDPVTESMLELKNVPVDFVALDDVAADKPLYRPPGVGWGPLTVERPSNGDMATQPLPSAADSGGGDDYGVARRPAASTSDGRQPRAAAGRPEDMLVGDATRVAYHREIDDVASLLRAGLSVLVECEKLVVDHMWRAMVTMADRRGVLVDVPPEDGGMVPRSLRQRQLARLRELCRALKEREVLVIPHLDLLAGGPESGISSEARELIELLYSADAGSEIRVDRRRDRQILAFVDPSLAVPEVLGARFSVRLQITGCPMTVVGCDGTPQLLGDALVTRAEAERFSGFDAQEFYKHVAGMNPVRLREALEYAYADCAGLPEATMDDLRDRVRAFKAKTSAAFEVPAVKWDDIGGYAGVKASLDEAIGLIAGAGSVPEQLRRELIPRGFIFYGPPGTGKTLFAKAIANRLGANVQVVSGPEVTDMYVGESERKVRELFAEARRNAPAVLVFDEFDAIAQKRSGREDGGSRAGNAIVAQILTEMDGFRPDPLVLVIGTTNRIDIIDPALLRPSRFASINIGLPDHAARKEIAAVHADSFALDVDQDVIELVVGATDGRNGDEIRSIFRDACIGQHCRCEPADAFHIGRLVGKLQRASRERRAEGG